jgi:hypothetical protein
MIALWPQVPERRRALEPPSRLVLMHLGLERVEFQSPLVQVAPLWQREPWALGAVLLAQPALMAVPTTQVVMQI